MNTNEITFALKEEIGNSDLFVGRKSQLDFFLEWVENSKNEISQSTAILARRRVGKTAIVQRLYNILYTKNDLKIIPFYFKIEEEKISKLEFSLTFYRALLSQYFGYKLRNLKLIENWATISELKRLAQNDEYLLRDINAMEELYNSKMLYQAWKHARDAGHRIATAKNERIIQIIDEFQYLDEYIYTDETYTNKIELASSYHSTALSKVSPQIITGSYIGWLTSIIRHMVARYREYFLRYFTDEEALAAVYNYSNIFKQPVTTESASFMTGACVNDAFYISSMFFSDYQNKDLTSKQSIVDTLMYETDPLRGNIAKMWREYIWYAFDKVNDKNAKKIVLYLAKHGDKYKTREQIINDLGLNMTEGELEERLHKLVKADIIAYGTTLSNFRGLGDKIFDIVFRRMYEQEIEAIDTEKIDSEVRQQLKSAQGATAYYKGIAAEHKVINAFYHASINERLLVDIVYNPPVDIVRLNQFKTAKKYTKSIDQQKRLEIDILCESKSDNGFDMAIEVKHWDTIVTDIEVEKWIDKAGEIKRLWHKDIRFVMYSENGFNEGQKNMLDNAGIMYTDGAKLFR